MCRLGRGRRRILRRVRRGRSEELDLVKGLSKSCIVLLYG